MKILLGVPEYPPYHVGGGGAVFQALANEYTKLGHEVMVVYGYYPSKNGFEKIKQYSQDGIQFVQVPLLPTPKIVPFLKTVLPTAPWNSSKLSKMIQDFNPDKAHLHGYGLMFINQLARIIWTQKIPYIYTLHGAPVSADKKGGPIKWLYNLYKQTRGKAILDHADDITAVSQYTIDNFSEFHPYKDHIRVVPNGIYLEEFAKKIDYNIYDRYNLPKESIIYLSIGRIEWIKGYDQFIKMIPNLVKSGQDVRYFIAGRDNGFKKYLEDLSNKLGITDRIYYLGFIGGDDKISAMQYSNRIVVPSIVENRPAVPLEAISMGNAPIVNNAGGMPEQIDHLINGLIINFGNIDQYKLIIKYMQYKKESLPSTLSKRTRASIAQIYIY